MDRFIRVLVSILLAASVGTARPANPVSVTCDGWTITADGEQGVLRVAYDKLGTLLKQVRLNLPGEHGLRALTGWSTAKQERGLSIQTEHPPTAWRFELHPNTLRISSTSAEAILTAEAPATHDRIVARLLDHEGTPVLWRGTDEVVSTYGGSETRNPSYLPRQNPECMYFALGQVSGSNLHSLFDRQADIAIRFSEQTLMQRDARNPDLLDITMPVPGNALVRLIPNYYTKVLGVPFYIPFDDSYFPKAPATWCSWDSYYGEVTEQDIVRNADWIAANLKSYGFEYIQLDDGYDRGRKGEHYWIENWDRAKFPHGPKWLIDHIKSKGLHAGIWIVPNAYAGAVEQHPDWYLRDKTGKLVLDYDTPALDSTNPQALDFLRRLFTTLDNWGFDYYKFDGEHALSRYAPPVDKSRLYDKTIDPIVAYRKRLALIRETIGPERFIEGCPAGTPLNGIGYFNSYFNGDDLYDSWQGTYAMFSSINANTFLNHMVVYTMAGEGINIEPPMSMEEAEGKRVRSIVKTIRDREDPVMGLGATLPEARTAVTYLALSGVVYSVSSVLPDLPADRVQLLKMTLPTSPIFPIDLFSRGTDMRWNIFKHTTPDHYIHNYPEILDLKVNAPSGVYDVIGLTNWRSEPVTREVAFENKLGLSARASYVAFDFWNQKLLGVVKDRMKVAIEPHDTRVLLIHPLLGRPQLVGTSRHITGAYSITGLEWDANTLRGSAEITAGDPYTLFIYVPDGMNVSRVAAAIKGGREISADHETSGNLLTLTVKGPGQPITWKVEFASTEKRKDRAHLGGTLR